MKAIYFFPGTSWID